MDTTFNLRDHSTGDSSIGHQRIEFIGSRLTNQTARIAHNFPQTFNIGEVHELFCSESLSNCPSNGVGIDVVRLTICINANGRNHRDELIIKEPLQNCGVNLFNVTNKSEFRIFGCCGNQSRIFATHTHCKTTMNVDRSNDLWIHLPAQHHSRNINRFGIGDPQTILELSGLAEPSHEIADLGSTTMNDDGLETNKSHQHNVLGE